MDGMGALEDAPFPPTDAGNEGVPMDDSFMGGMPNGDPNAMNGDQGTDPMAGGDPNAMGEGPNMGGDDISSKYQQLSPDQQKAADKYVDSMLNTESRNLIRKAIDETFSELLDNGQEGTKRPQKELENDLKGNTNSPFIPYN